VYFEIQSRNPHSFVALERLRAAVDRVMHAVAAGDAAGFAALMRDGESRTGAEPAPGA
jgi:prephenate dehydrogenase